MPLRERVVEIVAALGTGSAERYRYASGFRVGGRLVLTAAHVVAGNAVAGITVRGPDKVPHPARIVDGLAGDPDTVDLALLELRDQIAELPAPPVAAVDRDAPVPVPVEGCWAVGYPRFQEVVSAAGVVRETAQVQGMILPGGNLVGGLLSLQVTSAPRALPPEQEALGQSQWSGMSGAAVLAGERLIGVVSEHAPRRGESTITVTPLAALDQLSAGAAARWWAHLAADPGQLVMLPARQGRAELDPAFTQHFEPRSRGLQRASQRGWFFTGRTAALTELAAWLASDDDTSRVVTGSPGSGKSAVLSRLVVCSDPALRALLPAADLAKAAPQTLPPLGSIDVAVHAAGKTTEQVAAQIAATLNLTVAPALLPAVLAERDEPVTIAIDALDEAAFREDLVLKLVQPLVAEGVRLLLSARRDLLPLLRTGIVRLDLDDEAYFEVSDIAAYVAAYLRGAPARPRRPNPYRGSASDLPEMVGTAVADAATGNFLIAQLVALELVSRAQPVDPRRRDWDAFPSRVGDAMRIYLEAVGASVPDGYRWVRDLLAPLAYAEGTDLGDQLWADLATELGGDDYEKGDLRRLRADTGAAALLTAAGTGWRLFHQALAEYLREELARGGVTDYEAHRTIAARLLAEVPGGEAERRWWEAPPYVLTNLGRHAVGGGRLEDLVLDPGFLLWGDQDRQLPLLGRVHHASGQSRRGLLPARRARIGASGTLEDAATVLRITAQLRGAHDSPRGSPGCTQRAGAWTGGTGSRRSLIGCCSGTKVLSRLSLWGPRTVVPVAVTGGSDGVTVVWDLEIGAVLRPLAQTADRTGGPRDHGGRGGGGYGLVGDNTGRAELWDLGTGRSIRVITEEYSEVAVALPATASPWSPRDGLTGAPWLGSGTRPPGRRAIRSPAMMGRSPRSPWWSPAAGPWSSAGEGTPTRARSTPGTWTGGTLRDSGKAPRSQRSPLDAYLVGCPGGRAGAGPHRGDGAHPA